MDDSKLDKVIEALRHCLPITKEDGVLTCDTCPYYRCEDGVRLSVALIEDIRELLKKQEPMKPTVHGKWTDGFTTYDAYYCKSCNGLLQKNDWQFCPWCGQAVKWE